MSENTNESQAPVPAEPMPVDAAPADRQADNTSSDVANDLENHDEEDVKAALQRETQDGSGLENDDPSALPESDFDSFAEDNVEVESEEDAL